MTMCAAVRMSRFRGMFFCFMRRIFPGLMRLTSISISATGTSASVGFAVPSSTFSSNAAKHGYDTPVIAAASAPASGKYSRSATVPRPQPQPRRPSRVEAINHFVRPTSTTFAADYRKR